MTLAEHVLPLIRTRGELYRYSAANSHGAQMHEGIAILEDAFERQTYPAVEVHTVTQKALASALRVIARADDSAGIIGDACRRLLALHPQTAAAAKPPVAKLIGWMMKFQFDNEVDYFEIDPVAYAEALGETGMITYRSKVEQVAAHHGLEMTGDPFSGGINHLQFLLNWNAERLAVYSGDPDEVIRTHAVRRNRAAWLQKTALALEEVGHYDVAIQWAKDAAEFDTGHQSVDAAETWCRLLAEHRPEELLAAREWVFFRWPNSSTATRLHAAAGEHWRDYEPQVLEKLSISPRHSVLFVLLTLKDVEQAWHLAHELQLQDSDAWDLLVKDYQKVNPAAVLPVLRNLVELELEATGAKYYKRAARKLKQMRKLAAGIPDADDVDTFIRDLRAAHKRRPRLQTEFDRAGLP